MQEDLSFIGRASKLAVYQLHEVICQHKNACLVMVKLIMDLWRAYFVIHKLDMQNISVHYYIDLKAFLVHQGRLERECEVKAYSVLVWKLLVVAVLYIT